MLQRFFSSKLKHDDARIRLEAMRELPADDERLAEMAQTDADATVREQAVQRIEDIARVQSIATSDAQDTVRAAALARLCDLLAGVVDTRATIQERRDAALSLQDASAIAAVARRAREPELRVTSLKRVQDQAVLAEAACQDAAAVVRNTALAQVHDEALLSEALAQARPDKSVTRDVRRHLAKLKSQREHLVAGDKVCGQLECLASKPAPDTAAIELQRIETAWQQWSAQGHEPCPEQEALHQRYATATQQLQSWFGQQAEANRDREAVLGELHALSDQARRCADAGEVIATKLDLANLRKRWQALGATLSTPEDNAAFEGPAERCAQRLSERSVQLERITQLQGLLSEAQALHSAGDGSSEAADALREQWRAIGRVSDTQADEQLQQAFAQALPEIAKPKPVEKKPFDESVLKTLGEKIQQLETKIAAGELQAAAKVFDRVEHALADLPASRTRALHKRLQRSAPKLGQLQSWRRWGTDQARERLCDEAQALAQAEPLPPAEQAKAVRKLRDEWKRMDKGQGGAPRELWTRFNTACSTAYAPAEKHFAEQSAQRDQNLLRREQLAQGLQDRLAACDWDDPQLDWRALDDAQLQFRRDWRGIGPVNRKDEKRIEKRRAEVDRALEACLAPKREEEVARREKMIEAVQSILAGSDMRGAPDQVKRMQAQWRPAVRSRKKIEQDLWQRFRKGCDEVFGRLSEQRDERSEQWRAALGAREVLCTSLDELAEQIAQAPAQDTTYDAQARGQVRKLSEQYRSSGEVANKARPAIDKRFNEARAKCEQALKARQGQRGKLLEQALMQRAAACDALEQACLSAAEGEAGHPALQAALEVATTQWEAAEIAAKRSRAGGLDARYQLACTAASGDEAARRRLASEANQNDAAALALCLQLEIAAGINSPPELERERMAMQVSLLQASLSGEGGSRGSGDRQTLLDQWFALGPTSDSVKPSLMERFAKITEAMNNAAD